MRERTMREKLKAKYLRERMKRMKREGTDK
jgi:hypothetical protein